MKLALVIGTKERGARLLDQIVKGPLPYSEAVAFIKKKDHRKTKWARLAITIIKPERKYSVDALNAQLDAAEAEQPVEEVVEDAQ